MSCSKEVKFLCKSHGKEIQKAAYICAREISMKNVGYGAVKVLGVRLWGENFRPGKRGGGGPGVLPSQIKK